MSRPARMALELVALMALAWSIQLFLPTPMPEALNLARWDAKWIVYQGTVAVGDWVLLPMFAVLLIGSALVRLVSKEPNYWRVWRVATIVALAVILIADLGTLYGDQQRLPR